MVVDCQSHVERAAIKSKVLENRSIQSEGHFAEMIATSRAAIARSRKTLARLAELESPTLE
jgi:hypothetical protein